jgi:hypothetical protein
MQMSKPYSSVQDQAHMRSLGENLLAFLLGHAAQNSEDFFFTGLALKRVQLQVL